jgi:hypothetical protein
MYKPKDYFSVAWKGAKRVLSYEIREDLIKRGLLQDMRQAIFEASWTSYLNQEDVRQTSNRGQRAAYAFLKEEGFRRPRGESNYVRPVTPKPLRPGDKILW